MRNRGFHWKGSMTQTGPLNSSGIQLAASKWPHLPTFSLRPGQETFMSQDNGEKKPTVPGTSVPRHSHRPLLRAREVHAQPRKRLRHPQEAGGCSPSLKCWMPRPRNPSCHPAVVQVLRGGGAIVTLNSHCTRGRVSCGF